MFKHILIPTDGSEVAEKAVGAGIAFAKEVNARVTLFTALPEYQPPSEMDLRNKHAIWLEEHDKRTREQAERLFAGPAARAKDAGVTCDADFAQSDVPYKAIIDAATRQGCDLIFMSSHGRKMLPELILGSVTHDVLTHSKIPALVYR